MLSRNAFQDLMRTTFDELIHINDTKGHDYAGEENAMANFEEEAAVLGLEPEQVWAVFAGKHWRSIMTFCKEGDVQSEPIKGRVHDLIMYGFLLLGLIESRRLADMKKIDESRDWQLGSPVQRAQEDDVPDDVPRDRRPEEPWVLDVCDDGSFSFKGEIHTPFIQNRRIVILSVPRDADYNPLNATSQRHIMALAHVVSEAMKDDK